MTKPTLARRRFLQNLGYVAVGGAAALAWRNGSPETPAEAEEPSADSPEARLRALDIELPGVPEPANTYVPTVRTGNLLFVAGHGPRELDGSAVVGKVGRDLDLAEAQRAARLAGYRVLAAVRKELGTLDRIERLVRTLGMVNAAADFTGHSKVINGFSDLMAEIFGKQAGIGARSAVGMSSLPGGIPVEVETVFAVK